MLYRHPIAIPILFMVDLTAKASNNDIDLDLSLYRSFFDLYRVKRSLYGRDTGAGRTEPVEEGDGHYFHLSVYRLSLASLTY